MLFNSYGFIFLFLPLTYIVWLAARRWAGAGAGWLMLLLASLIFYGVSGWRFLALLCGAVIINHALSVAIAQSARRPVRRTWLILGISANLGFLFYFKYAAFILGQGAALLNLPSPVIDVVLPLGISFYTFQQIAYLIDVARDGLPPPRLDRYGFFITFFPQLIAGPIVHHQEMIPQLDRPSQDPVLANLAIGSTIFVIGLFKKLIVADSFSLIATPIFDAVAQGRTPGMMDAWVGTVAYGLQIYFDFSAYSDMAIGLGRMFGIILPINFASPYRARSVVEFWRRWHITLSRFLRDYLYISLGGNRGGTVRRYVNIFLTMFLGGIWHGAGFTFVLWGAMHGAMIIVDHLWRSSRFYRRLPPSIGWMLAMLGVFMAWVPFRAADLTTVGHFYWAMTGLGDGGFAAGFSYSPVPTLSDILAMAAPGPAWHGFVSLAAVILGIGACVFWPNTQTLLRDAGPGLITKGYESGIESPSPSLGPSSSWRPTRGHAALVGVVLAICILKLNDVSEFIYFRF